VDDHPIALAGLRQLAEQDETFDLISSGTTTKDLLEIALRDRPDVILTDLSIPGRVLDAITRVNDIGVNSNVVVFSSIADVGLAIRAMEAGAKGYVLKSSPLEELVTALQHVRRGDTFITASFAVKIAASIHSKAPERTPTVEFSRREEEVLRHLLRGLTNKEIASVLNISEKTVKQYMTIIIQKLNVRNRVQVVLAAQRMFSPPSSAGAANSLRI
jgi:DNA-binding NarL/FixJ family response regulator